MMFLYIKGVRDSFFKTMGYYKDCIEQLNAEYKNRTSITLFGRQASMLRLLADAFEVRLSFEKLLEMMKQGPFVFEDSDLNYLGWADEARWQKPEEQEESLIRTQKRTAQTLDISSNSPFAQTYANYMKDAFGERLKNIDRNRYKIIMSSVIASPDVISDYEFDLAIDENIRQLRKTLIEIHNFTSTQRWKRDDYGSMYLSLFEEYRNVKLNIIMVNADHNNWLKEIVAEPDVDDLYQRRRELLLELFNTGFLDAIKSRMHVPAEDDLQFCVIKDEALIPDLTDTLKWYAAFKKLCPWNKNVFCFNEYATLGKYIYDNHISIDVCKKFFHIVLLLEIVQQELEWIEHPELRPQGEDETLDNFVDRVKRIMLKAEDRNGEKIEYEDNKHNKRMYEFWLDGKLFGKVMDEVREKYPELIIGYLDGKTGENAIGVTKVCSFIGCIVDMYVFNEKIRKKDLEPAFQFVFGEKNERGQKRSFIQKMSLTNDLEDKPIFATIKTLYNEQKKAQLLKEKK